MLATLGPALSFIPPRVLPALCAMVIAGTFASAQPTAPRARIVEEFRLDANKEDFSVVGRVVVGPRRQIVVPLPQDRQIRLYDSVGKPIARMGGRGSGPGEFVAFAYMGWVADTLWVSDRELRRITYYSPDGKLLRSAALVDAQMRAPAGVPNVLPQLILFNPTAVYADGAILAEARLENTPSNVPGQVDERVIVRTSIAGASRLIARPPRWEDARWQVVTTSGFGASVPFMLRPMTAYTFDGSRFAHLWADVTSRTGGTFYVSLFNARGDTLFARAYPFTGVPIPQASADSALATFIPRGGAREGPADTPQQLQALARARMPAVYTPVESVILGLDETIWINMRPAADGTTALVLDRRGVAIATLALPRGATLRQATATHIWTTEVDADGLASVVRYRVSGVTCAGCTR